MTTAAFQHVLFPEPRLELKPEPNGFGFLFGQMFTADGGVYRIDLMPPASEWSDDMKPSEDLPHPTDWVINLLGREFARVRRRDDIVQAVTSHLVSTT